MMDFGFYNMDCLEGMKEFPDNYFDLAIVDPPYGDGLNRQETDNKELGVHFHGRGRSKKYQEVYAGKSETLENLGGGGTDSVADSTDTRYRQTGRTDRRNLGKKVCQKNRSVGCSPETGIL